MATRTTYLNLIKPDYSDAADIADINANMDTLDDKIKGIDSAAIDDTLVPTSDSGTIRNQLSQLANRIKAATGAGGWKDDPSTTLASLATLVSNLAIGSDVTWDGKKFTNTKLGISGLMDANGYVSFGKNFGGLILQWGKLTTKVESKNVIKPNIDCTILVVIPVASFETNARSDPYPLMYATPLGSSMRILVDVDGSRSQDMGMPVDVFWFAIGTN